MHLDFNPSNYSVSNAVLVITHSRANAKANTQHVSHISTDSLNQLL